RLWVPSPDAGGPRRRSRRCIRKPPNHPLWKPRWSGRFRGQGDGRRPGPVVDWLWPVVRPARPPACLPRPVMKKLAGVVAVLCLLAATAAGHRAIRIYSHPPMPSREVLGRLDLRLAWGPVRVPTVCARDGLLSMQLVPGPRGDQLVVQTLGGVITALDPETGDTLWRTAIGRPYQ